MRTGRSFVLSGAALSLVLGVAACGGGAQQTPATGQQVTTTSAPATTQYWDPKAPRAGAQRSAGMAGDWDDDDLDDDLDDDFDD